MIVPLWANFVEQAALGEADNQRLIDQHIGASNAFIAAYGSRADAIVRALADRENRIMNAIGMMLSGTWR